MLYLGLRLRLGVAHEYLELGPQLHCLCPINSTWDLGHCRLQRLLQPWVLVSVAVCAVLTSHVK
jgi:hypothetical protein